MSFPFPLEEVTEGLTTFTVPKLTLFARGTSEYIPSKAPVFYNPRMKLNRDLAVLAVKIYQKRVEQRLRVCDPLTGCGIRGIRFAREVKNVDLVVLNDLKLQAARLAEFNTEKNQLTEKILVKNVDARALLGSYASDEGFNVIDIDPYGSPSPFLDFALVALKNRGLLALTATDTAPLCGVNPKACIRRYLGKPLRTEYCHELALRLLINSVVFSSAKYNLGIDVLLSHRTDHYIRVYIQVRRGAERANKAIENIGYVLHCFKCLNRRCSKGLFSYFDSECDVCGSEMAVAGPMWLGKLGDRNFCGELLDQAKKIGFEGGKRLLQLLTTIYKETDMPPTYFVLDKICGKLRLSAASRDRVIEKLGKMGYQAVGTHFNPQGIKSNVQIQKIKEAIKKTLSS